MNQTSQTTIDHDMIRRWAEDRGAQPTTVKGSGEDGAAGVIRLDLPGWTGDRTLEAITWDEFFEVFERNQLAFLYQDATAGGERSNFNKLVKRAAAGPSRRHKPVRKTSPSRKTTRRRHQRA